MMKDQLTLPIASLITLLLTSFHHCDDVVRGMAPGGLENLTMVAILLAWLYATLELAGRRSGYVVVLLGSLAGAAMPILHMALSGLAGPRIGAAEGQFFFAWTAIASCVSGSFAALLSVRALWRMGRSPRAVSA